MYIVRVEFWDGFWTEVIFSSDEERTFEDMIQKHGAIIQLNFIHVKLT